MQLKAILCRTSTKKQLRNAYYKITPPNLLFEYQCTSGKFIRLPNRIEKIDSVAKIESNRNFFSRIGMLYCRGRDQQVGWKYLCPLKGQKVAHTRLPSIGFRSWSRFLAVSLQVTWRRGWTEARRVWTVCLRLLPYSIAAAIWTRALLRLSPAR